MIPDGAEFGENKLSDNDGTEPAYRFSCIL